MSRMAEQQMQEDDRRNDSGMDDYLAWIASIEQDAIPVHKREGYSERMYEIADFERKSTIENNLIED